MIEPTRHEMPENPTEAEEAVVGQHFLYLKGLYETGIVKIVGRTLTPPYVGLAIFEAEDESHAARIAQEDPAIAAGVFKVTVSPFALIFS